MRIKLYRINTERDVNRIKFVCFGRMVRYQHSEQIDAGIYDLIFDGEADCETLKEAYAWFNSPNPERCHLFISDIVEVSEEGEQRFYFFNMDGFRRVDFEPERALSVS